MHTNFANIAVLQYKCEKYCMHIYLHKCVDTQSVCTYIYIHVYISKCLNNTKHRLKRIHVFFVFSFVLSSL